MAPIGRYTIGHFCRKLFCPCRIIRINGNSFFAEQTVGATPATFTPMTADVRNTLICDGCLSPKPVNNFRLRRHGGAVRMKRCRECHNRYERERRSKIRRQQKDRRMGYLLAKVHSERSNKRLTAICDAMTAEFGGVQGFVDNWRDYYRRSLEQGGLGAVRSFQAYLRLVRFGESLKRPQ